MTASPEVQMAAYDMVLNRASNVDKTLRQFSMAGPCLTFIFGKVTRETEKSWFYEGRDGQEKRVKKTSLNHVDPCHRCRDHAETDYPMGYMD